MRLGLLRLQDSVQRTLYNCAPHAGYEVHSSVASAHKVENSVTVCIRLP